MADRWVAWDRPDGDADRLRESSPGKLRYFCSMCGSHLVAERAVQSHVILRVATLDDDSGEGPRLAIWQSQEIPWLDYGPGVPGYAEVPAPASQ